MWVKYKPHSVAALLSTLHRNERNIAIPFRPVHAINADSSPYTKALPAATGLLGQSRNDCNQVCVDLAATAAWDLPERLRCSRGIWTEWLMWKLHNGKRLVCATMQRILQRRRIRTLRLAWSLMAVLALILAVCSAIFTVWTMRQTRDLSRSFQTLQERLEQVNAMSFKCTSDACMHSQAHLSKQFSLITQWFCNYAFSFF